MTEETGGAIAPADATPVAEEPIVETPNPVDVDNTNPDTAPEGPKDDAPKPERKRSTREALAEASKKIEAEAKEEAAKAEKSEKEAKKDDKAEKPKEDAQDKPKRDAKSPDEPDKAGDPKAEAEAPQKTETTPHDAPSRFSSDAKAEWANAPESVKAEARRAISELESGIQEHQKKWEPLKQFEELATKHNTTIDRALDNYTRIDAELERDLVKGLEMVCQNKGYSLSDVAAHVMGQDPDQARSQTDAQMREIANENAALKQQLSQFQIRETKQQTDTINSEVAAFKANKEKHPRFEELEPTMAKLISTGLAENLSEAYQMAETFKPSATQASTAAPATPADPAPDLAAQTRKGSQSVTGAPTPGSNPVERKRSNSIKEALQRAQEQVG